MANIFNDLNKLVNTIDKVDKLLTEKPKKKSVMIPLSEQELLLMKQWFHHINVPLMENWHKTIKPHQDLYDKLIRYKKKLG
jgi:hypothetical protein